MNDIQAELVIEVDGDQREVSVSVSSSHPNSPKKVVVSQALGRFSEFVQ